MVDNCPFRSAGGILDIGQCGIVLHQQFMRLAVVQPQITLRVLHRLFESYMNFFDTHRHRRPQILAFETQPQFRGTHIARLGAYRDCGYYRFVGGAVYLLAVGERHPIGHCSDILRDLAA